MILIFRVDVVAYISYGELIVLKILYLGKCFEFRERVFETGRIPLFFWCVGDGFFYDMIPGDPYMVRARGLWRAARSISYHK